MLFRRLTDLHSKPNENMHEYPEALIYVDISRCPLITFLIVLLKKWYLRPIINIYIGKQVYNMNKLIYHFTTGCSSKKKHDLYRQATLLDLEKLKRQFLQKT